MLPRYDIHRSYEWNYVHPPEEFPGLEIPPVPGNWDFCGIPVDSPLGIPAGPLLNSRWILHYASLGFSVLTYKTVRSRPRASYEPPNLLPVDASQIDGEGRAHVSASTNGKPVRSWAISFGMPSRPPDEWQADIGVARRAMAPGQALAVSVVASPGPDWTQDQIIADFVRCARWAWNSGAQAVEANLSCPNVCSQEGQIYHSPELSGMIAAAMRDAIPKCPLILKIGLFRNAESADAFVAAVSGHASALSTVNSISATVGRPDGAALFDGISRGIGGECIRERCQQETVMLHEVIQRAGSDLRLIAVGGISTLSDVRERLAAGAHHTQLATAVMLNPIAAIKIRSEWRDTPA